MTAKEQIGRLQDLLERVQLRAQQARGNGVAAYAAPVSPAAAYAEPETYAEATPSPAPVEINHESFPPATHAGADAHAYSGDSHEEDGDVEVSSEVVEVDIDIDEPIAMESGAQPVAQQTMPPEELEELEELDEPLALTDHVSVRPERPSLPRPTPDEEITQAFVAPTPAANEIEEPAPSSSRRPIAAEEAVESYGEESAPRHTPPPESGKQVAAPSVHPALAPPVRAGSEPSISVSSLPPSLEGHTLIGGWREPGLGGPQIGPPGGAGPAGPGIPTPMDQPGAQVAPAQVSGTRLTPDITRPEIAATATVARIESPAAILRPATMGDLLDLTLAL